MHIISLHLPIRARAQRRILRDVSSRLPAAARERLAVIKRACLYIEPRLDRRTNICGRTSVPLPPSPPTQRTPLRPTALRPPAIERSPCGAVAILYRTPPRSGSVECQRSECKKRVETCHSSDCKWRFYLRRVLDSSEMERFFGPLRVCFSLPKWVGFKRKKKRKWTPTPAAQHS